MRVFIATFAFKPDSCKSVPVIALAIGEKYKILSKVKRTEPGIWILVEVNKAKYDVFLTNEEIELGIIEKVTRKKR